MADGCDKWQLRLSEHAAKTRLNPLFDHAGKPVLHGGSANNRNASDGVQVGAQHGSNRSGATSRSTSWLPRTPTRTSTIRTSIVWRMRSTGSETDVTADKWRINRVAVHRTAHAPVEKASYQQVLMVARGGIEPPNFRFADGSNCGTLSCWSDKLDQQGVVERLIPTPTADNRRTDSTPAQGWTRTTSPRRVLGWPDGAPRSLLYPMSGRPLHHTTGNPDQRLAAPAEQFDVLPRDLGTAIDFCPNPPRGHQGADCGERRSRQTGASLLPPRRDSLSETGGGLLILCRRGCCQVLDHGRVDAQTAKQND